MIEAKTCGSIDGCLHDDTRRDWDDAGARPVRWTAWYPASGDTDIDGKDVGTPTAPSSGWFVPEPLVSGAALSGARSRWPLVLLSHGTGGSAAGLGWLGRRLANAGFVCLGVSHHGNTALEPLRAEGFLCWWERAADLSFVLDRLDTLPILAGRIDHDRVHAVGFSLGGYTVLASLGAVSSLERFEAWRREVPGGMRGPREFPDLEAEVSKLTRASGVFRASLERHANSFADARIRSAVALAPAPPVRAFTDESLAAIERGVLLIAGEADAEAPFTPCAAWLAERNPAFELRSLGAAVGHYVFLPECTAAGIDAEPVLCVDAPGVDRRAVHERTAAVIVDFLGRA